MRKTFRLDTFNPVANIGISNFKPVGIAVYNHTGSAIYIREGSQETPNAMNADYQIAAGEDIFLPVIAQEFAAAFADTTVVASANSFVSGFANFAKIEVLAGDEPTPAFGSISNLSLSLSSLIPITAYVAPFTIAKVVDIGAWGGALVWVSPTGGSGQGVIQIDVSEGGVAFSPYGTFAFWPGLPSLVSVPRVARFMRITLNSTAIVGEPAIAGLYSVRATIAEVQTLAYNPANNIITKNFNLTPSAAIQYSFVTIGLPAVSIAAISTVGTGAGAAITLLVEASSDNVNWRRVTFRDQKMSTGITLYRALGNLDVFMRVTIFEISGANNEIGTLYMSVPPQADLGYILNTIQQSLGDNAAPSNTNQDIYHQLDSIRQLDGTINTVLGTNQPYLANLPSILSQESTYLPYLPLVKSNGDSLVARQGHFVNSLCFVGGPYPYGGWQFTGAAIPAGQRIIECTAGFTGLGGAYAGTPWLGVSTGSNAAIQATIYETAPAPGNGFGMGHTSRYADGQGSGILMSAGFNFIWVLQVISATPLYVVVDIVYET